MGVHQGFVLCPLLFIVLEVLPSKLHMCCAWELLYADDLIISAVHGGPAGKSIDKEVRDGEKRFEFKGVYSKVRGCPNVQ